MLYMCAVLDLCGRTVLAWRIGDDMASSLVTDTVKMCIRDRVSAVLQTCPFAQKLQQLQGG